MTYTEAREKLKHGCDWGELAEAVGVVIAAPECSDLDLFLSLKHGGVIAEQAALALYRKTQTPIPDDRRSLVTTTGGWVDLIMDRLLCARPNSITENGASSSGPESLPGGRSTVPVSRIELRDALISCLNRTEKLLLMLYYYEEMRFDQIAPILDMTEDRLRKMHHDILVRLRATVGSDAQPLSRLFRDVSS